MMECDRCGKCCEIVFFDFENEKIDEINKEFLKTRFRLKEEKRNGVTLFVRPCPNLAYLEDGRAYCIVYERRPIYCREFEAGGKLCFASKKL